jgi:hypothetical protein
VAGQDIRLGDGSADVLAAHDGNRYVTVADTSRTPVTTLELGHTLPRGAVVASVTLDGRRVTGYETRETNRGLEVTVPAKPRGRHVLVVTAG